MIPFSFGESGGRAPAGAALPGRRPTCTATLTAAAVLAAGATAAAGVKVELDGIATPDFSAKAVVLELEGGSARLAIGELAVAGRSWRDVRVVCPDFRIEPDHLECRDGSVDAGTKIPVSFAWRPGARTLELTAQPGPRQSLRVRADLSERSRRIEVTAERVPLAEFARWLPAAWPKPGAGTLQATLVIEGAAARRVTGTAAIRDAGFSDAAGLNAGEKLEADLRFSAREAASGWQWTADLGWQAGEVYWQPLYLKATGQRIRAEGTLDAARVAVERSTVTLPGIGEIEATAQWDRRAGRVASATVTSGRLDAAALYARLLQPHFAGTALADLRVAGALELARLRVRDGQAESFELGVHDLSFEDAGRRFAVFGANGRIPWHRSEETRLDLAVTGGEVLRIPFGAVRLPLAMRGTRFRLESFEVPVLDGRLTMKAFATERPGGEGWRWSLAGELAPISMERFTQAFGWPAMHGSVAARIPRITYSRSTLRVDGALVFNVFDGTIEARNLVLAEPLGRAPRLGVDLDMRNLDLELVTRTFSFGTITGRVDARVAGLELVDWRPVRFDARVASSPGEYPRKVSQAAVENITALGGAGASAAIQRTFLRFFEQFSYARLGWSCRLENAVCRMGGVEDTAQGYVIVKGAGVPALTVMGYNRTVDWPEFVERLKRVVQDKVNAVVR